MHHIFLFILLIFNITSQINSQEIINPVINFKTHSTLNIEKILKNSKETVFYMSIKNEMEKGGAFCVDKNVFVSIPGKRIKFEMIKSEGIENCPDYHKFNTPGEIVNFKLYFPVLNDTIQELDLVENCNNNCFTIRGIILNQEKNSEIHKFDSGVYMYRNGQIENARKLFKEIVDNSKNTQSKYYAYAMYILPVIYYNQGKKDMARKSYKKLMNSNIQNKKYFLNKLEEIDFFKKLRIIIKQ